MLKGFIIGKDLESFLNEHPEIQIVKRQEKIIGIRIPEDIIIVSLCISNNNTIDNLEYIYNGELYSYDNLK